ncbi:MAG: SAM-dependent methyltransferase [Gammaproteobacteria bacterium]|nr:SAM-dependent methyltransferase [Gammaproteobacteria bacterium]MDH5693840.1 SAM-dependent methyltransferase [Gammaproteobacteria bacterium]
MKTPLALPEATPKEQENSAKLLAKLRQEYPQGILSFAEFMANALYTAELGYYSGRKDIFGESGDFVTAPELTDIFSKTLANPIAEVLSHLDQASVAEFGGGSGTMAADILLTLEKHEQIPQNYFIIEISAILRKRQAETIGERAPHLLERVVWVEELPKNFIGVVVGNEILDALPVFRLLKDEELLELVVSIETDTPQWKTRPVMEGELNNFIQEHYQELVPQLPKGYHFEVCLSLKNWMRALARQMKQGVVLLVDYGYPRQELFRPDRHMGTLACHYRHRTHDDALWLPGQQDITAHVDFTLVAELAVENDLDVLGFAHQAGFLLGAGIEQYIAQDTIDPAELNEISNAKKLLMPSDMGESFKVIALGKEFEEGLSAFTHFDQRMRL